MINDQRIIAVIPARGGSKSVPGKNIRPLGGIPLIAWSIRVARQVTEIDRVIVSTDDHGIAAVAREHGAEVYVRPAQLATDAALVIDALHDLRATLEGEGEAVDIMVLLEPTCPFRARKDVRESIVRLVDESLDSVATFKAATLNPHRAWRLDDGVPRTFIDGSIPWLPRQQLPVAHQLSGDVYAFRASGLGAASAGLLFGRTGAVIVSAPHSFDIDDELDFRFAELIASGSNHESFFV
ncbi:acylneuraminate cytidylyltransferase family protein [Modicisalibacter tunisiensis]|uniref:acylneuraminate cytidylyltransferase family protein n=1 Tax=Modicisalibacter tunisiensis TaxID=390637 RepID=UPI001CCA9EA3|nr:acylneuraminate cytidylyltransferase family protein [Modicisalibacter tunisiensis]MBZ9538042.1 acylneuraminate cytidylyltransferase family protein [Modicisalibacter tunisiensis]